ncbi:hypothetical protein B0H10DRAFT_2166367 [Mycena sp. CBHHK59/15]|nr:hypothetical protein B0H10DRAFT_2166367 [Mycena sp. CBHHK59/15]
MLDLDATGYWKYVAGPDYILCMQVQGLDAAGNLANFTVPGNEAVVDAVKKNTEAWLLADNKAHALIVKAVPSARLILYIALKREYELPMHSRHHIKQQIIAYQCDANEDPVNWRQVMIQLYGKLWDFAKHLVTLMSQSDKWRRLKEEEVEMKIAPSIVSINAQLTRKVSAHAPEAAKSHTSTPLKSCSRLEG